MVARIVESDRNLRSIVTRRSLLPDTQTDEAAREAWRREIRQLEQEGIE